MRNNSIRKVTPGGTITTVAGTGIAGDDGDNIAATGAKIGRSSGVAMDSAGNLYIADFDNNRIRKVDVSDAPSLTFADTNIGAASAAQDVTVLNLGNDALFISQISTPAGFSLQGPDTSCSSIGQTLNPAASCVLGIEFNPTASGGFIGGVTLTDNTLNAGAPTQTINLQGTGTKLSQTINCPVIGAQTYGVAPITLTCTASSGLGVSYSLSSGPASLNVDTLTITGTGLVTVQVTQAGDATYLAAPLVNVTFTVNAVAPTVTFTGAPASAPYKSTFDVASTTESTSAPVITVSGGSCSIASTTVTMTKSTGTCTVKAQWAADANYLAATLTQTTTATGIPPYLSASTLAFGTEGVGVTTAPKSVTFYNYSGGTVTPGIPATVDTFATSPGTCAGPVLPNKSCSFTVTFTPADATASSSTLNVDPGTGPGDPPLPLTLTGTGTAPSRLSVATLAFGNMGVGGTTVAKTVNFYNYSGGTVTPGIPATVDAFATSPGTCGVPLATNKFCTFNVTFTPTALTAYSSTLNVDPGTGDPALPLALTGTGIAPFRLSVSTLAFGNMGVGGTTAAKSMNFYNYSGSTVTPVIPAVVDVFATSPGTCGSPVLTGKYCSFTVTFTPTDTLPYSSTLNVDPGTGAPALPLGLTGTGIPPFKLSVATQAFGNIGVGATSAAKSVTFYNYSGSTVTPIIPAAVDVFATSAGTCGGPVLNNKSCSFTVTFTPTDTLSYSSTLNVDPGTGAPALPLGLTGTGIPPFKLSVAALAFGSVTVNVTSGAKTVTFYNYSGSTVTPIIPAAVDVFATSAGGCGGPVLTGKYCSFTVTFKPLAKVLYSSTLNVDPGGGAAVLPLALSGTGK